MQPVLILSAVVIGVVAGAAIGYLLGRDRTRGKQQSRILETEKRASTAEAVATAAETGRKAIRSPPRRNPPAFGRKPASPHRRRNRIEGRTPTSGRRTTPARRGGQQIQGCVRRTGCSGSKDQQRVVPRIGEECARALPVRRAKRSGVATEGSRNARCSLSTSRSTRWISRFSRWKSPAAKPMAD